MSAAPWLRWSKLGLGYLAAILVLIVAASYSFTCAAHGWDVTGFDISDEALAQADRHAASAGLQILHYEELTAPIARLLARRAPWPRRCRGLLPLSHPCRISSRRLDTPPAPDLPAPWFGSRVNLLSKSPSSGLG